MQKSSMREPTERTKRYLELVAIFGAFALFLSTIEYLIPKPLPFIRIGLANLPILVSLSVLPVPYILLLTGIKIIGQGLINGSMFSYIFVFSFAGSLASAGVMIVLHRVLQRRITLLGISVFGALASNFVQLFMARLIIIGEGALLIAPPFLSVGLVTSILLGLFAVRFTSQSRWYRGLLEAEEKL